jgi:adenylate cyclase class 2
MLLEVDNFMSIEVEAKAYAEDLNTLEKELIEKGAKFISRVEQKDTYFNHPNRDFAETDEALRIREADGKTFFTYKGPKM